MGKSGRNSLSGVGDSVKTSAAYDNPAASRNGERPASVRYINTPSEKMSVR